MHLTARIAIFLLPISAAISAEEAGPALPKRSPFELRGGPAAPVATASETIEFAGVSSIGKKTDLIFYDKSAKKSHWIAEGETKEGIAVIKFDPVRDEALVKVNGVEKTLALRKVASPAIAGRAQPNQPHGFNTAAPSVLPAPVAALFPAQNTAVIPASAGDVVSTPPPPPGSAAEIQKKQETEARMLVSDLLEIGMAQRRAYEEAQRKAAEGTPPAATSAQPAQTPVAPN